MTAGSRWLSMVALWLTFGAGLAVAQPADAPAGQASQAAPSRASEAAPSQASETAPPPASPAAPPQASETAPPPASQAAPTSASGEETEPRAASPNDPLEPMNRAIFTVNSVLDEFLVRPHPGQLFG